MPTSPLRHVAVTGTPATGKTLTACRLGRLLGARVIDANAVATAGGCVQSRTGRGEMVINTSKLARKLKQIIASSKQPLVLEGHLLCEFALPVEKVLAMRTSPQALEKRLKARGYAKEKIEENLLAEILDYCLASSQKNYGESKVVQLDSSRKISDAKLVQALQPGKSDEVDWMPQLLTRPYCRLAKIRPKSLGARSAAN